jgi:tetratricopeptide (TPR) repeat protein
MKILLLLIALLSMICAGDAAGPDAETLKIKLDQAEHLLDGNSPEKAIEILDEVLKVRPKDERALYLKGQALRKQENFDDAIKSYDRALSINPDYPQAMAGRCEALIAAKKCREGQNCCSDLVEMDKESDTYRVIAGNAIKNPACFEPVAGGERYVSEYTLDAIAYYDGALLINNNSTTAWNNKGVILGELGTTMGDAVKVNESLACFDAALEINSSFAEARNNKGVTMDRWGEWEKDHLLSSAAKARHQEALKCYDQALVVNSNLSEAMFNKAETLGLNESDSESAQEYYKKAVEINPRLRGKIGWIYIEIVPEMPSQIPGDKSG